MVKETEQTNPQTESTLPNHAAATLTSQEAEVVKDAIIKNEKVVLSLTLQAKLAKAQEIELEAFNNATLARAIAEEKRGVVIDLQAHNNASKVELYNQLVKTASDYQILVNNASKAEAEAFNAFQAAESTALELEELAAAAKSVKDAQQAAIDADQATNTAITLQHEAEAERNAYEQKLKQAENAHKLAKDAKKTAALAQEGLEHSPHVTKLFNTVDGKTVISPTAVQDIIDENEAAKAKEEAQARVLVEKLIGELDKSNEAAENVIIAQNVLDKAHPVKTVSPEDATIPAIIGNDGEVHLGGDVLPVSDV